MKNKLSYLLICLVTFSISGYSQTSESDTANPIFTIVENMPVLGKCKKKWSEKRKNECTIANVHSSISDNLKYPEAARLDNQEGTVFISFVINKKGKVTDVTVIKGISNAPLLNDEAKRIVEQMPKWQPGKQRGKKVKVKYILPIKFKLN